MNNDFAYGINKAVNQFLAALIGIGMIVVIFNLLAYGKEWLNGFLP